MRGEVRGSGGSRIQAPPLLVLVVCAAISCVLALRWVNAAWGIALTLALVASVATVVVRLDRLYAVSVIALSFCLGHLGGAYLSESTVVMSTGRPDLMVGVVSVVRALAVGAGVLLAGMGSQLRVKTGRSGWQLWLLAALLVAGLGCWYRSIFFPAIGIFSYGWYLDGSSLPLQLGAALLSSAIRAGADELAFRGWIQASLGRLYGPELGVATAALMAGILHYNPIMQPYGVSGMLAMTGLALLLGIARHRTGGVLLGFVVLTAANMVVFFA